MQNGANISRHLTQNFSFKPLALLGATSFYDEDDIIRLTKARGRRKSHLDELAVPNSNKDNYSKRRGSLYVSHGEVYNEEMMRRSSHDAGNKSSFKKY